MELLILLVVLLEPTQAVPPVLITTIVNEWIELPCIRTVKPIDWKAGKWEDIYKEWQSVGFRRDLDLMLIHGFGVNTLAVFEGQGYYHCRKNNGPQLAYNIVSLDKYEFVPVQLVSPKRAATWLQLLIILPFVCCLH